MYIPNLIGIDLQRVFVQYNKVREFSYLKRTGILFHTKLKCCVNSISFQCLLGCDSLVGTEYLA